MRRSVLPPMMEPVMPPSRCALYLYYTWKVCTRVFSHAFLVTLVVAYCILGAFTFESLEADNERMVKGSIMYIRGNVTEELWLLVRDPPVLAQDNWTDTVVKKLVKFETDILKSMKEKGWDGNEDESVIQWTFAGALFYSIIVITTIGYGHIAPKTHMGKVVTIFYAILGIPLMLLCLSNIGDIMASSFRFLYWRVCCCMCTRKPKKHSSRRNRSRGTVRQPRAYSVRSRPGSLKRSVRHSQRSADSGLGPCESVMSHSYSDTEFRYHDDMGDTSFNSRDSRPISRSPRTLPASRLSDATLQLPLNSSRVPTSRSAAWRAASLDRRPRSNHTRAVDIENGEIEGRIDAHSQGFSEAERTPVLCNKYALEELRGRRSAPPESRCYSLPRHHRSLAPPNPSMALPNNYSDVEAVHTRTRRRERSAPSPRIMSPMGFAVNRQQRPLDDFGVDYHYTVPPARPVPIWLCVFLVVSYIIAGAFLFARWEKWSFLDAAYFCFITLTTIGFGDFVPAQGVKTNSEVSIALCSLYLLFGIALLAMSFNLVQEEVIANVKSVAKRLGILKDENEEDSDG